jgi:hypothetical protein
VKNEFLVGGKSMEKRGRQRRAQDEPVPPVGFRFLMVLVVIGGCFVAAGAMRVNGVFAARDYEMETSRLQDAMRKRSDRAKTLMARVSHLQRGEILKTAAEEALGMAEPLPAEMETVLISEEAYHRWESAATAAATSSQEEVQKQ